MFFSDDLLTSKKGSLAATLGPGRQHIRKLSKRQLASVNLSKTCELIAEPPEPMALRLSGCLLVGVARVYNHTYAEFYNDVTNFHSTLRRAIMTDSAFVGGSSGEVRSLDLPGGGTSKFDAITFGGLDAGWQASLDLDFLLLDWSNPGDPRRKLRSTSKLDSLASQSQQSVDEEETDEDESEDSDDDDVVARTKRQRLTSSPFMGRTGGSNIPRRSERTSVDRPVYNEEDFAPIDLGLDAIFDQPADTSFSEPSRPAIELPEEINGAVNLFHEDFAIPFGGPDQDQGINNPLVTPARKGASPIKSAMKKRLRPEGSEDDVLQVEEELEGKRTKRVKKVAFDPNIELFPQAQQEAMQAYAGNMEKQRREARAKEQSRVLAQKATEMVDSGGGFLEFFDPEMQLFFAGITKVDKWKWELDVAANKTGGRYTPNPEPTRNGKGDISFDVQPDFFADGLDGQMQQDNTWQEWAHDVEMPMPELSQSRRRGSELPSETGRFVSGSQPSSQHPWDVKYGDEDDHFDAGAANSSFSPGSLKLSMMTPQEIKIRNLRKSSSSIKGRAPRSRSGSVLGERGGPGEMLIGGDEDDDLELPMHDGGDDDLPGPPYASQLPEAFKPEMLATLEKSCRKFFMHVENAMNTLGKDEIEFDELVSFESTRKVAAAAFYNCLTLATKKILHVDQPDPWDTIILKFTASLSF
ncbi:hypothetical protein JCM24511_08725 [Saitozyma sp. JCM 24511]|nr:hypothetical protein JCM24511_08725 [Saitozyma sp. JCM 24511]